MFVMKVCVTEHIAININSVSRKQPYRCGKLPRFSEVSFLLFCLLSD